MKPEWQSWVLGSWNLLSCLVMSTIKCHRITQNFKCIFLRCLCNAPWVVKENTPAPIILTVM